MLDPPLFPNYFSELPLVTEKKVAAPPRRYAAVFHFLLGVIWQFLHSVFLQEPFVAPFGLCRDGSFDGE